MAKELENLAKKFAKEIIGRHLPKFPPIPLPDSRCLPWPGHEFARNQLPVYMVETAPEPGAVIATDLAIIFEHSGIYAGGGKIIHRHGEGWLEEVDRLAFQGRLEGLNPAFVSYVACIGERPFSLKMARRRARQALGDPSHPEHYGYDLLNKNCHHFTRYCLTGYMDQWGLDFTFGSLEALLMQKFHVDNWRICKI